ncbi:MAG: SDR family NAD(P)-dependent oxidoreductase [Saprospiraceae bacterium]|nr:SDR family NAD(P)-dependent oxidoreductase [Saprospiraceae bacterium]
MKDKVVIVTGSSMGIGKALANELAKDGAMIVLNGRNSERLQKVHRELKANGAKTIAIAGDVSKIEDCKLLIDETIKAFGRVDVVINNAGLSMEGTVEEVSLEVVKK